MDTVIEILREYARKYDEEQPRGADGKWTSSAGAGLAPKWSDTLTNGNHGASLGAAADKNQGKGADNPNSYGPKKEGSLFSKNWSDKQKYDPDNNKKTTDFLKSKGFIVRSHNQDPHQAVVYAMHTDFTPGDKSNSEDEEDHRGQVTHTVMVHPNGAWDHFSEGSHKGTSVEALKHVNLAGWDEKASLKKEFSTDERKSLAKEGKAMPDGSYPITNGHDLESAIHLAGMGNDSEGKIKAHIKARAKDLGLESKLPDTWTEKAETILSMRQKFELGLPRRTDPFSNVAFTSVSLGGITVGRVMKQHHLGTKAEYKALYEPVGIAKKCMSKAYSSDEEALMELARLHFAVTKQESKKTDFASILKDDNLQTDPASGNTNQEDPTVDTLKVPAHTLPDMGAILRSPGRDRSDGKGAYDPKNAIS